MTESRRRTESGAGDVERLTISMLVTDVEAVREVLACIDDLGSSVRLESMSVDQSGESRIEIDVDEITPKQWEALSLAFEEGYYDRPRKVDLEQLAEQLAISKSAVSQRLRAAEATLMESIVTATQPTVAES